MSPRTLDICMMNSSEITASSLPLHSHSQHILAYAEEQFTQTIFAQSSHQSCSSITSVLFHYYFNDSMLYTETSHLSLPPLYSHKPQLLAPNDHCNGQFYVTPKCQMTSTLVASGRSKKLVFFAAKERGVLYLTLKLKQLSLPIVDGNIKT